MDPHNLPADERIYIELKLALGRSLRDMRRQQKLTQVEFARLIGSSQSRVAMMEAGDPSVSLDLLVRGLLALGATNHDLARMISFSKLLARPRRS
jgi:transcriptional regulator with XRE-family HTH domain